MSAPHALRPPELGLIMGIPRGGTTLATALLDSLKNCVCLSEPHWQIRLKDQTPDAATFAAGLAAEMARLRQWVIGGGPIVNRRDAAGNVVTNYFAEGGNRQHQFELHRIQYSDLDRQCLFASKHIALYASALPELVATGKFRIVAVLRDPADAIASWRTLDIPVGKGRLTAAEKYWPATRGLAESPRPLLERQILLYELLCSRVRTHEGSVRIVRYEELVTRPELIAEAFGRTVDPRNPQVWAQMPNATSPKPGRSEVADAVKRLVALGEAPSLAHYYPTYR